MYNEQLARDLVQKHEPLAKVVDSFPYEDLVLVRVEHASEDEANYDPFYSVNSNGVVSEFSVITDGDPVAIGLAFEQHKGG